MKTTAAVLTGIESDWQVLEIELDGPSPGEVLVEYAFAGLCHTDQHFRHGNGERLPMVGGHEGAGIVLQVGDGVSGLTAGDHVVALPSPTCGRCYFCARHRENLCLYRPSLVGLGRRDGTFRFRHAGQDMGAFCGLGTFSQRSVVYPDSLVKIDPRVPLQVAALISCGVLTGWGAAVNTTAIELGDNVLVIGAGGVGLSAVLGAAQKGARSVAVLDSNERRHELARALGATHTVVKPEDATRLGAELNPYSKGFDHTIVCVGNTTTSVMHTAFDATGSGGAIVVAALSDDYDVLTTQFPTSRLVLTEKRLLGSLLGSTSPRRDVPRIADLFLNGAMKLDSLVTTTYALEDINLGFRDLLDGLNARGVIEHAIP